MYYKMENDIDIKKLIFVKSKGKSNITNYIIITTEKIKPKIIIKNVIIPFGVEKYNNSEIINLEIRPKKDNEHNNIYALIDNFENNIKDKQINNKSLINDIGNKEYHPNLKKSKLGYLLRTHIHSNVEVFASKNDFKFNTTLNAINQTICDVEIELGTLWINNEQYGYIWGIKKIEIIKQILKNKVV